MLWSKVTAVRFAVRGTDKADSFLKVLKWKKSKRHNKAAFADSSICIEKSAASRLACGNAGGGKFDRRDFPGFFNKEKKQDDEKNSSGLFDKL